MVHSTGLFSDSVLKIEPNEQGFYILYEKRYL